MSDNPRPGSVILPYAGQLTPHGAEWERVFYWAGDEAVGGCFRPEGTQELTGAGENPSLHQATLEAVVERHDSPGAEQGFSHLISESTATLLS